MPNYALKIFFLWYSKNSFLLSNSGIGSDALFVIPKFLTVTLEIQSETTKEQFLSILMKPKS